MSRLELCVLLLLIPAAWLLPQRYAVLMRQIWRKCPHASLRPTHVMLLFVLLTFAGNMAFSLLVRFPEPYVVDEYSYLFGAETFLAGRLTTPTPPFHSHFSDIHNIETPTWQMKYPPGQSLLLALGGLTGYPIVGAWLGTALAIGGIYWMLQGILPRRWAVTGTLVALLNWWIMMRFGQSYRGASGAMLGGAMTIGALVRVIRTPKPRYGILLAAGLFLLAINRPYEGLISSLPAALLLLKQLCCTQGKDRRDLLIAGLLPCALTLLIAFAWLGYYQKKVTGSALLMPYQVWSLQKSRQPLSELINSSSMLIKSPQRGNRRLSQRLRFILKKSFRRITPTVLICFPVSLMVCLAFLPLTWRQPWTGFIMLTAFITWLALLLEQPMWVAPEYASPTIGLNSFLITQGLRGLYTLRLGTHRMGSRLAVLLIVGTLATFFFHCLRTEKAGPFPLPVQQRLSITAQLQQDPAKDLVLVNLPQVPDYTEPWIHNHPDLEQSEIIWARQINADADRKLRQYFRDRIAWELYWVQEEPRLRRLEN